MKVLFFVLLCLPAFMEAQISSLGGIRRAVFDLNTNGPTTVSSQGPDLTGARYYVYLTGAAYCLPTDLAAFQCKYCKLATGQTFSTVLSNTTVNTQALVTTSADRKEIVVAFRGSYNVPNFVEDATLTTTDASQQNSNIKVHHGFLLATWSLYPQVVSALSTLITKNPGYSVVITGHSLGAGMASITLFMLMNGIQTGANFPSPTFYSKYTFGQPRTGNQAYADYWNSQSIEVTRTVSRGDIIPHAAISTLSYLHHGTELWNNLQNVSVACSKSVYEDPNCSNSLAPLYDAPDHLLYFDVDYTVCAQEDALPVLYQFVVNLNGLQS